MAKNEAVSVVPVKGKIEDMVPRDAGLAVMDAQSFLQRLKENQTWTTTIVVKLAEGQGITGQYMGPGAPIEFMDGGTGEVLQLKTWNLKLNERVTCLLMGNHDIDQHMANTAVGLYVGCLREPGQTETRKGWRKFNVRCVTSTEPF